VDTKRLITPGPQPDIDWTARPLMPHHWHSRSRSANFLEGDVPTYQYACTACGHQLEAVQSFADDPLTECPACEGRLRKLYSSVGIVFKGSGFYRTDSRNGNGKGEGERKTEAPKTDTAKKEPVGAGASAGTASSNSGSSSAAA
jgi:putative FmdB family regulatory protein